MGWLVYARYVRRGAAIAAPSANKTSIRTVSGAAEVPVRARCVELLELCAPDAAEPEAVPFPTREPADEFSLPLGFAVEPEFPSVPE